MAVTFLYLVNGVAIRGNVFDSEGKSNIKLKNTLYLLNEII